ncbi:ABC transporter ATP-binding protein [Flavobacterium columnare NBRC 100251 = ATCC 23463]|uniref:Teichoic-acid-transporting ATPase n=2 Tax=Flavobacterium columnare TaxID=996 RepID=G8X9W4_FLACA|nr:ABC transporter ATP-binding protein [Flavobacterium columnare]AEW87312.1 Teichoic-acid-transporting ATPase [Flavobacterium columnare ATCC 49512]ANO48353.1 Teichoic-acid-transporting ATPase [Flavobacterium columnare]MBF6652523.1 ABC transporter ATP-binding protein [Flavobacterium columnare]MBF6655537.1 ABC transporter ATP-binding protein [Flavobacterium columnare]MBF6658392.1 ABC transporter ATP-binding protein [Flavobacterium columnare]
MKKKDIILRVENISKQYRLGVIGTGTLSHDINRWWHKIRGKEDPYLKVGESNDRTIKGKSDYVWALKDINFEVERGEVLGIIGKNGAGKSTLLKILSKVTTPSTGVIKSRGRIASLLEVGTGFNPELTGRENIYLNGAILGMTKAEINSKIDQIIDFSGCERYIDTPTKRYSSGMTVRLAFAVAAFLEPEILIIDEVLAVGDAEFQKKAIGKMQDISKGEGRTVLFVSHDMSTIKKLCKKVILLEHGTIKMIGDTDFIISEYLKVTHNSHINFPLETFDENLVVIDSYVANESFESVDLVGFNRDVKVVMCLESKGFRGSLIVEYKIYNYEDKILTTGSTYLMAEEVKIQEDGFFQIVCNFSNINYVPSKYFISIIVMDAIVESKCVILDKLLYFEVIKSEEYQIKKEFKSRLHGVHILPQYWSIQKL